MTFCIYIYSNTPIDSFRTDLEDNLEDLLGDAGECTGGGQGSSGWNIDLEIFDRAQTEQWIKRIKHFLKDQSVPKDTYFEVMPIDWHEGMERHVVHVYQK